MKISELFYSLQGEGFLAGVPSVFVRLAGCPLRCGWCDTAYAWRESSGVDRTTEFIVEAVKGWHTRHVVVTGGEPLLNEDRSPRAGLAGMLQAMKAAGKHITIETAGIAYVSSLPCDLMSISPKLGNAFGTAAMDEAADLVYSRRALRQLIDHYDYQLKFVVEGKGDLPEIEDLLMDVGGVPREKVLLMPQAKTRQELLEKSVEIAKLCEQNGYVLGQRLQVFLWEGRRGR